MDIVNSPEMIEKILSSVRNVVILTDLKGDILYANSASEPILGYFHDELVGKELSCVFSPEDLTYLYPNLLYLAQRNESFEGEIMLLRKDGVRFFASVLFRSIIESGSGKTMGLFSIQDIDREKQLERAVSGIHYEDLIRVASGVAHELRNPLVGIGGFANRLYKSCKPGDEHDRYYGHIIANVMKIEELVKKIEFFASLPRPYFTEESIRELIEKAMQPFFHDMLKRNIKLTIDLEELVLFLDRDLIIRVFSILTGNALDAMVKGGSIKIQSETQNKQLKIFYVDTGSGIAPENMGYVFNPFFSTKADGVGIDLATAKLIMDSHGGHIGVSSTKEKGTTFMLTLPLERRRSIRMFKFEDKKHSK